MATERDEGASELPQMRSEALTKIYETRGITTAALSNVEVLL